VIQERVADRLGRDERRLDEERLRVLRERLRKVVEQAQQQKEIFRQRAKDELKEFGPEIGEHHRGTTEGERQNNIGAAFGPSVPRQLDISTSAPAGSHSAEASMPTRQQDPGQYASASKLEEEWVNVGGNKVDLSGTEKHVSRLEEEEWVRRAEERARQQLDQFNREQLENERQDKDAKAVPEKRQLTAREPREEFETQGQRQPWVE